MNSQSPEDRLLDELLREQAHGPDEAFLKQLEAAVDAGPSRAAKLPTPRRYGRLAIAAGVGLAVGFSTWSYLQNRHPQPVVAAAGRKDRGTEKQQAAQVLSEAIRDQEDKVEESRKVLATIARTKQIIYRGQDSYYGQSGVDGDQTASSGKQLTQNESREEGISRGLDALDFGAAKREAEADQQSLQAMRQKRDGLGMGDESTLSRGPATHPQGGVLFGQTPPASVDAAAAPAKSSKVRPNAPDSNTGDSYGTFIDQPWKSPDRDPLSTFSIDVDTASYSNVRRMIKEGREIPRDAVRIEECINAFTYHYQQPKGDAPFAVSAMLATCPWAPAHQLVRVAIKGREIETHKRPASNLVFLIDVSGSMQSPDKLPLLKQSMATLVEQLDERDRVAIVVYAGKEGVALPSTRLDAEGRATVLKSLAKLEADGSTNGGAGIKRAYELALKGKIAGGVNRVLLATDGDFNVGVTGQQALVELVKDRAKSGVYLTVLGFGTGNLNDAMMDAITRDGNGNYFYIDSEREGRKVFLKKLTGTLVTIAKDVKIQVEFNPAKVGSYRLIGYSNRVLRNKDFANDKVDAGDIGAGHTVTAFYELTPPGTDNLKYHAALTKPAVTDEWLTVKLRHKHPDGEESRHIEFSLTGDPLAFDKTDADFQFAAAAALFGMKLRQMDEVKDIAWDKVLDLAKSGLAADDATEDRAEFVELVKKLGGEKIVGSNELEGAEGPNARQVHHENGSSSFFSFSPDKTLLYRKLISPSGVLLMTATYYLDANGSLVGCKILDGQNQPAFMVSYGFDKSNGRLVQELMFDSRVKRINQETGKGMPVQKVTYEYDTEGKRSEPIVVNLLPGETFERIFGLKSAALGENPFDAAGELGMDGNPDSRSRNIPAPAEVVPVDR